MAKAKKKAPVKKAKSAKVVKAKKPAPKKAKSKLSKVTKVLKTKIVKTKAKSSEKIVQKMAAKPTVKSSVVRKLDYSKAVTPLGDRLVVRLISADRMTAGGLYIPDTVSQVEGHMKGEVLAAGKGILNKKGHKRPLDVTVGDQIYFNQYSATKVTFGGEELHIVKEVDVLGVAQ